MSYNFSYWFLLEKLNHLTVLLTLYLNCLVDRTNITGNANGDSINWNMTIARWAIFCLIAITWLIPLNTTERATIELYKENRVRIRLSLLVFFRPEAFLVVLMWCEMATFRAVMPIHIKPCTTKTNDFSNKLNLTMHRALGGSPMPVICTLTIIMETAKAKVKKYCLLLCFFEWRDFNVL